MFNKINNLNEKAWDLRNTNITKALALADKAYDLASKKNYELGIANSLVVQGYAGFRVSQFEESQTKIRQALSTFETQNDKLGIQRSTNILGIIYGQTGDFKNALKAFLKVKKLANELQLQEVEADSLTNLAIIYMHYGDYALALEYNLDSLRINRVLNKKLNETKALQNIGVIYFEMLRFEDALRYFHEAESLLEEFPNDNLKALVFSNLGRSYHRLKNDGEAEHYQKLSLALMEQLEDKSGMSFVMDEIGRRLLSQHNYSEAETFLQTSFGLKQVLGDRKGKLDSLLILGELYTAQNKIDKAQELFKFALSLAGSLNTKAEETQAHAGLVKVFKVKEQYEDVVTHLEEQARLKEEFFNSNSDQRFQGLRVRYEVEQTEHEKEIYRLKNVELVRLNKQLQTLTEKLEKQAIEDPLTKLFNRRHFENVLQEAYKRSFRYKNPLSVMICDIDNFKKVNDTFSHAVGDEVLIQVAKIFTDNLRETDTLARYGGEEFVALFPETNAKNAAISCNRFRILIEGFPWHTIHPDLKVTISMGVCEDISLGSGEAMISQADVALYEVKRNGKNHVRIWQAEGSFVWQGTVTSLA